MALDIRMLRIEEAVATEDGSHILIFMQLAEERQAVLSMPASEAIALIDATAAASSQSEQITESEETPAAAVSWFELGPVDENNELYLTLTFGSGGRLTFILQPEMASQLQAALHLRLKPPA